MKRKIVAYLLMTAMAFSLIGCGKSSADNQATDEAAETENSDGLSSGDVELTVWAEEDNFDVLNQMIASFEDEYKGQANFTIHLEAHSDADMKNDVLSDVHADVDVFSFPDDQFDGLMAAGVLAQVPNSDEIKSANVEGASAAATYNDAMFAYPYTADNGYFIYYNSAYLSEEDVATLDGIMAVCEANGKAFQMDMTSGWYMYSFFGGAGLDFGINDDGVTNHCNWNATDTDITGVDIARSMQSLMRSPYFINGGDGDFVDNAKNRGMICFVSGTWNATAVADLWGDDYAAAKMPTYTVKDQQLQMASFTGYKMFGVNDYSDQKEWAHKLAAWFSNEQNQTLRFEECSQGPSNIKASESDAIAANPAISAVIEQSQYGTLQRVGSKYWAACSSYTAALPGAGSDDASLQELMDTLTAGITASTAE